MAKIKTQSQALIETLKKINYVSVEQMVEDINRNFAVVENSPLFKGIPGNPGDDGDMGLRGARGSQFVFVYLEKFVTVFPKELQAGSNITIEYLNSKLLKFEDKQLLLKALGITEFVNNDIIVLTNSLMLSYDLSKDILVDTALAFNEQSNIISSIEKKIEAYVKYYVDNNPTILNLQNIFERFATIGKNYSDTNNTFVTRRQSGNSALVPYIPGLTNNIGAQITDHKYFGFAEKEFPIENKGTIVFGSIKRYTQLILDTMSVVGAQTIAGGYVPTDTSIPTTVLLQDTYNAGILFGYKGKTNLKRFASIYKNDADEVVFKSDMGNNPSEYSELLLHKNYLRYAKLVDLLGDIHLVGDYEQSGNMRTPFIRTAKYTKSEKKDDIEIGILDKNGKPVPESVCRNVSGIETYEQYPSFVFVTDEKGVLLKQYAIEKTVITPQMENDLNIISPIPNDSNKVLTSNYLGFLIRKINSMCQYCVDNYWRKNQWNTGEIPDLSLSNDLKVGRDVFIKRDLSVERNITNQGLAYNAENNTSKLGRDATTRNTINGDYIATPQFKKNVFVSDENGVLSHLYELETVVIPDSIGIDKYTDLLVDATHVLTSNYFGYIQKKFNNMSDYMTEHYWRKNEWNIGVIPDLHLTKSLKVNGNGTSNNPNFSVNDGNVKINGDTASIDSNLVNFGTYKNNVLVIDGQGLTLKTYSVETTYTPDSQLGNVPITSFVPDSVFKFPTSKHINWLQKKINSMKEFTDENYWTKPQFENWQIPNLFVNDSLKAKQNLVIGVDSDVDEIAFSADAVNSIVGIGKKNISSTTNIYSEKINYTKFKNKVIVCDANGAVLTTYEIEKINLDFRNVVTIPQTTTDEVKNVDLNNKASYPNSPDKVLTSNYYAVIIEALNNIKLRLKNTFTQAESRKSIYDHMPVGSIILWTPASSEALWKSNPAIARPIGDYYFPAGWRICDELNDVYARGFNGVTVGNNAGGENNVKLLAQHLPTHQHFISKDVFPKNVGGKITMAKSGDHQHRLSDMPQRGPWCRGGTVGVNSWGDTFITDKALGTKYDGSHTHEIVSSELTIPFTDVKSSGNTLDVNGYNYTQIAIPDPKWSKMWYLMKIEFNYGE